MKTLTAIAATIIGAVTWVTVRSVRRYENELADRRAIAVLDAAERIIRVEQSRMNHPSQWGKS